MFFKCFLFIFVIFQTFQNFIDIEEIFIENHWFFFDFSFYKQFLFVKMFTFLYYFYSVLLCFSYDFPLLNKNK